MNKTRSHLHIFSKKNYLIIALNLHRLFVATESTMWVLFIFLPSKIHVNPTGVISSLSSARCRISSSRCHHIIFRQRFVPSHPLSSQNQSIEFAPVPPATVPGSPDSYSPLLQKDHLNLGQSSPPLNRVSILPLS
jgi:hypothetical protein